MAPKRKWPDAAVMITKLVLAAALLAYWWYLTVERVPTP